MAAVTLQTLISTSAIVPTSNSPNNRSNDQHQPNHDTGKVRTQHSINDDKHVFVTKFPETEVDAGGEEEDEHLQVEKEGWPGGRLVFRDRGDDGDCKASNVNFQH